MRAMLLRSAAAAACFGVLAPTAAAATTIRFNNGGPGPASVVVSDGRRTSDGYIELVRGCEVIARSPERDGIGARAGYLTVPSLIAGDVGTGLRQRRPDRRRRPTTAGRGSAPTLRREPAFTVARPAGRAGGVRRRVPGWWRSRAGPAACSGRTPARCTARPPPGGGPDRPRADHVSGRRMSKSSDLGARSRRAPAAGAARRRRCCAATRRAVAAHRREAGDAGPRAAGAAVRVPRGGRDVLHRAAATAAGVLIGIGAQAHRGTRRHSRCADPHGRRPAGGCCELRAHADDAHRALRRGARGARTAQQSAHRSRPSGPWHSGGSSTTSSGQDQHLARELLDLAPRVGVGRGSRGRRGTGSRATRRRCARAFVIAS